jgi:hypothetical protein
VKLERLAGHMVRGTGGRALGARDRGAGIKDSAGDIERADNGRHRLCSALLKGIMSAMPSKSPLPQWIPPQLTQLVETAPSGPQWLHEIKLDGFRMAIRIEGGRAKLLTRTGLDWSTKYAGAVSALAAVRAVTAYLDGELCGVGGDGLPNFAETQAATDGARGVRLVFYAFDLLHLDGRDAGRPPLREAQSCSLSRLLPVFPAYSSTAMRLGTRAGPPAVCPSVATPRARTRPRALSPLPQPSAGKVASSSLSTFSNSLKPGRDGNIRFICDGSANVPSTTISFPL